MRVSCKQENLTKALAVVNRAVATRSTLPITGNVLLATDQGRLKLSATNLEIAMTSWVVGHVEEEGAITVPARMLSDMINSLPNDTVHLELVPEQHLLKVRCGRFHANLKGIDADEFPLIPTVGEDEGLSFTLPTAEFKTAVEQVIFAAAKDDARPVFAGILLRVRDNQLHLVACDSFRLSLRTLDLAQPPSENIDLIVPARVMSDVARVLNTDDEHMTIAVTPKKSQVLFHTETVDTVSRLVDGQYPDYPRILNQVEKHNNQATMARDNLLQAVRFTSFVSREANNALYLDFVPGPEIGPGVIKLTASAADVGDNAGEIDALIDGPGGLMSVDSNFLNDALGACTGQQLLISFLSGQTIAVLLRPVGDMSTTHIIMPMQIQR